MVPFKLEIRLNGKDQTSGSATAKQKEEGAFSHKCHHDYILYIDSCHACVYPVCNIQTLVQQVGKRFFVLVGKADL